MRKSASQQERGYTLLEYCAGAAIIAGILFTALQNVGTSLGTLLDAVATWSTSRAGDLSEQ